jgi:hypothetical protein
MHKIKIIFIMLFILITTIINAQTSTIQNSDIMRSNGKIYVVMAVVVTIVTGLLVYLFQLDRKIKNLEKDKS